VCTLLISQEWRPVKTAFDVLETCLQANDSRLQTQAERTQQNRAKGSRVPDCSSDIIPAGRQGTYVNPKHAALAEKLQACQFPDPWHPTTDTIVKVEREWYVDADATAETQRQQFKRAMDELRAHGVCYSSVC
jgi:hypothetical protein